MGYLLRNVSRWYDYDHGEDEPGRRPNPPQKNSLFVCLRKTKDVFLRSSKWKKLSKSLPGLMQILFSKKRKNLK